MAKLYCNHCRAYTEHIPVTYGKAWNDNVIVQILANLQEINPLAKLVWGDQFSCTRCGQLRLEYGLFSNFMNRFKLH